MLQKQMDKPKAFVSLEGSPAPKLFLCQDDQLAWNEGEAGLIIICTIIISVVDINNQYFQAPPWMG